MLNFRAASNSGAVALEGSAVSNQWSASARSSSYQRGKKVVRANSGKTTTSRPTAMRRLHQPHHAADRDIAALRLLDGAKLGGGEDEAAGHADGFLWLGPGGPAICG